MTKMTNTPAATTLDPKKSLPYAIGIGLFALTLLAGVVQSWRIDGRLPAINLLQKGTRDRIDRLLAKEDYDSAIHELEMLAILNPQDAGTHLEVGRLLLKQEQPQRARPHLEQAVRLQPRNAEAFVLLSMTCEPAEAVHHLQQAVALNQEYPTAFFGLGIVSEQLGDLTTAEECFTRLLELSPENEQAKMRLKTIRAKRGASKTP